MKPIVLAYSGGFNSSIAAHWLAETHGAADLVTLTVDVGQGRDLGELRGRAISCGAVRAHAIDGRDELARECLRSSGGGAFVGGGDPRIDELPRPLIARKLVEIARIEGAGAVAHGSVDTALDDCIHAIDPDMYVMAPAREWAMNAAELAHYASARAVLLPSSGTSCRIDQNLWGRTVSWADGDEPPEAARPMVSATPNEQAHIDLQFERGIPTAVNGVPMSPAELVESLTLIAGRHGVGRLEGGSAGRHVVYDAPAAVALGAALASLGESGGLVRLAVLNGRCTVVAPSDPSPKPVKKSRRLPTTDVPPTPNSEDAPADAWALGKR
jgi:argininosuccinate synthase